MAKPLSYRDAGVNIDAGDALVEAIKPFARRTLRPEVRVSSSSGTRLSLAYSRVVKRPLVRSVERTSSSAVTCAA